MCKVWVLFHVLVFMSFVSKISLSYCVMLPCLHISLLLVPLFYVSCSDWLSCSLCHVPIGLFLSCVSQGLL